MRENSVEPQVALKGNTWLKKVAKSHNVKLFLEQEDPCETIADSYKRFVSKTGGQGKNRPDAQLLLTDEKGKVWPVVIEYKGKKGKLLKTDGDGVDGIVYSSKLDKSVSEYAINGAIHYANAILTFAQDFDDIIVLGMTGWMEGSKLVTEIACYYVGRSNAGIALKVGEFSDFSFLEKDYFEILLDKIRDLGLSDEQRRKKKELEETDIATSLTKLNNEIYEEEGISEQGRIYIVASTIMANLGVYNKEKQKYTVVPLEPENLASSEEKGERDGDRVLKKVENFLKYRNLPEEKRDSIIKTLDTTLTNYNINKPDASTKESQLKRVFRKIVEDLARFYKSGITIDFAGKLFNEMFSWLGFSKDKLNDVVLTPSYVCEFLVKLARVNKDSYVWDLATGSASILVAAMNEMIRDAEKQINSPEELELKKAHIRANQLLGVEILPEIYMLAVLNMILMGDGSSNLINKDSLRDFDGKPAYGDIENIFPATAFVLNPPYSADGCGMVFVERALSMMQKGYAAFIIQSSAGSGKASEYNKRILKNNKLIASIKMPIDLFLGKSSVQTYIYVIKVGEKHDTKDIVRFIDFSNDGYKRADRKKAKAEYRLRDVDHAKERYEEVVNLVHFGGKYRKLLGENEFFEGSIDPNSGSDWNQSAPVDIRPKLGDFKKTISDYLSWEVSNVLKEEKESDSLGK